jgi:hypothetical protein
MNLKMGPGTMYVRTDSQDFHNPSEIIHHYITKLFMILVSQLLASTSPQLEQSRVLES